MHTITPASLSVTPRPSEARGQCRGKWLPREHPRPAGHPGLRLYCTKSLRSQYRVPAAGRPPFPAAATAPPTSAPAGRGPWGRGTLPESRPLAPFSPGPQSLRRLCTLHPGDQAGWTPKSLLWRETQGSGQPAPALSTPEPRPLPPLPRPPPQVPLPWLTCLPFAQRLLQPIGAHILGVLGWVWVWVREVVGGGAPASLLGPGRHGALGPGPTGPPAAPPTAGRPVSPVGAGDRSVPAPPAAPHFSGGPQGDGLGPPQSAGRGAGGGGAGPGGSGPGSQHGPGGLRGPPSPALPWPAPPSCASPRRGGLRCGPADAAGRGPPRPPHAPSLLRLLLLSASPRHLVLSLRQADITIRGLRALPQS